MKYGDGVISSREALDIDEKLEHLVVVGGGYIGLELGITHRMLGAEVTIVEAMDSVLPIFDKELRRPLELFLKKNKIKVNTGVFAKGAEKLDNGKLKLNFIDKNHADDESKMQSVKQTGPSDRWTQAEKRRSCTNRCRSQRERIRQGQQPVPNKHEGVYAIGDVTDLGEMLAHVASFQGEMVAEIIAGKNRI